MDNNKNEILPVIAYRDSAVLEAKEQVEKIISASDNFKRNGIQPLDFNTIYQLYRDKQSGKLNNAKHCLMIPDYLSFKLTGVLKNEYTNATTGAIVNANSKEIDTELLNLLGIIGVISILSPPVEQFEFVLKNILLSLAGTDSNVKFCSFKYSTTGSSLFTGVPVK